MQHDCIQVNRKQAVLKRSGPNPISISQVGCLVQLSGLVLLVLKDSQITRGILAATYKAVHVYLGGRSEVLVANPTQNNQSSAEQSVWSNAIDYFTTNLIQYIQFDPGSI